VSSTTGYITDKFKLKQIIKNKIEEIHENPSLKLDNIEENMIIILFAMLLRDSDDKLIYPDSMSVSSPLLLIDIDYNLTDIHLAGSQQVVDMYFRFGLKMLTPLSINRLKGYYKLLNTKDDIVLIDLGGMGSDNTKNAISYMAYHELTYEENNYLKSELGESLRESGMSNLNIIKFIRIIKSQTNHKDNHIEYM
jgi:hypothetical protein